MAGQTLRLRPKGTDRLIPNPPKRPRPQALPTTRSIKADLDGQVRSTEYPIPRTDYHPGLTDSSRQPFFLRQGKTRGGRKANGFTRPAGQFDMRGVMQCSAVRCGAVRCHAPRKAKSSDPKFLHGSDRSFRISRHHGRPKAFLFTHQHDIRMAMREIKNKSNGTDSRFAPD